MKLRLKEIREAKEPRLTLEAIAERVGKSVSQVSRWESGRSAIQSKDLDAIATAYETDIPGLFGVGREGGNEVREIPLLGRIVSGAWEEAVKSTEEYVYAPAGRGRRAFALKPVGDSMNELIGENGYVVVDPDQTDLVADKVYIVIDVDMRASAKRFCVEPLRFEPCTSNPSYKPIIVGKQPFTVIGRVTDIFSPL
ncbi:MAG: S24 family peptidase [Pseudomonadota bacterium]|nr:S24 family peptidase [Pseudomonadota bacterium]